MAATNLAVAIVNAIGAFASALAACVVQYLAERYVFKRVGVC